MRVVRGPRREGTGQGPRGRRVQRELRHRDRVGSVPSRGRRAGTACNHGRRNRLLGDAPAIVRHGRARAARPHASRRRPARHLASPDRGGRARASGRVDLDGARADVRRVAMGGRGALHAGDLLVRLAVPPRHLHELGSPRRHDGHARDVGNRCRVGVVDGGADLARRRVVGHGRHGRTRRLGNSRLLRDRSRYHRTAAARQVLRDAGQAPVVGRLARAFGDGCEAGPARIG